MFAKKITVLILFGSLAILANLGLHCSYSQAAPALRADGGSPIPPYPSGIVTEALTTQTAA